MFGDDGRIRLGNRRAALGPTLDPIIDRIIEAEDADVIESAAELAIYCLRQNYAIGDTEWARLVYFETSNDENMAMWRDIIAFARGGLDRPKHSADGSEPRSEPSAPTPTA